jgi:NAD(P)-dependent dehydrogenase (short-subunit alcohol dehydrogenase family)
MRLANKVAVVTGGAAGIGFAYARRFLAEGARVVVADVADPVAAAEKLGAEGRVLGMRTDVSDIASLQAMVDAAVARFGRIDVLVNNAAVFASLKPQPFDAIPEAEWDRVMAVNVKGTWLCATACVPVMREQGVGAIVNIASTTAINGSAGFAHYVASKGAVIALTRSMAREVGPLGIRVNVIAPGFTLTDASRELFEQEGRDPETYALDRSSLKRPAQPEDVVGAALWLASDGAGYVTGQTIVVDGGRIFV